MVVSSPLMVNFSIFRNLGLRISFRWIEKRKLSEKCKCHHHQGEFSLQSVAVAFKELLPAEKDSLGVGSLFTTTPIIKRKEIVFVTQLSCLLHWHCQLFETDPSLATEEDRQCIGFLFTTPLSWCKMVKNKRGIETIA